MIKIKKKREMKHIYWFDNRNNWGPHVNGGFSVQRLINLKQKKIRISDVEKELVGRHVENMADLVLPSSVVPLPYPW